MSQERVRLVKDEVPQVLDERNLRVRDHLRLAPLKLLGDGAGAPFHQAPCMVNERCRSGDVVVQSLRDGRLVRFAHVGPVHVLKQLNRERLVPRWPREKRK